MKATYIFILFILCSGCKKFIEVDLPVDQPLSKQLFETNETATSTMTGFYSNMMRNDYYLPYYLPFYSGLYADELNYSGNVIATRNTFKNDLNSKDSPTNRFWTNSYNFIYQANSILLGLETSHSISASVEKQLRGEALFLRAFWHFYLTNFYGEIPVVTTTNYLVTSRQSKVSVPVVYGQIEKDLVEAKSLLTEKYVAANSIAESAERIRPNKYTVSALLSRVYLFQKKYSLAEQEASSIIESGLYTIEPIDLVFKRKSKEAIWQIELPTTYGFYNSWEATYFILTRVPSATSVFRSASITQSLYNQFSPTDVRRTKWISSYKDVSVTPNVEYRYPSKYKSATSTLIDEYTSVFRLSEIYLIRAEARAQQGNLPDAINDSDRTRLRAGLTLLRDTNPGISKEQLLQEISSEKQRELFCEWGIRWMDIRRSDMQAEIVDAIAKQKAITWKQTMLNWPLPLNDVINNTNLKQNDGYQ